MTLETFLLWIAIGLIAGWLASAVVGGGYGVIGDIVVGVVGAFLGGFVLRWLTAHEALGGDVELIGADYHPALIDEARRLAEAENLSCRFEVANAFRLKQPATVYISTGILHHFRGRELIDLFAQHNRPGTCAFMHFDFHQSALAPFGPFSSSRMVSAAGVLGCSLACASAPGSPFPVSLPATCSFGVPMNSCSLSIYSWPRA